MTGIPQDYLTNEAGHRDEITDSLKNNTYVGIDFGTSTTVVSYVVVDEQGYLATRPMVLKQYDDLGRCYENSIIPSCIVWTGTDLLVGQGAAALKRADGYNVGINLWHSFKMLLGRDLGPEYNNSKLNGKDLKSLVIQSPKDAAHVFFDYLREKIMDYIESNDLPPNVHYAVSVPAAFEANQRRDLCDSLGKAGIKVEDHGIIDEPNAAFMSYIMTVIRDGSGIANALEAKDRNVLVFDFGAGTCDISILNIALSDVFISKNLAVSQFHGLGGNNIDRCIATEILWDQVVIDGGKKQELSTPITNLILDKLQPIAELLKIAVCKRVERNWNGKSTREYFESTETVTERSIKPFKVANVTCSLPEPTITFAQFAQIMKKFSCSPDDDDPLFYYRDDNVTSVFEPIKNALEKANLSKDDLDMILFIGGSSRNPFVQSAIREHFGRFVTCEVLGDARTPVSRGAAIHIWFHSLWAE